LSLILAAVSYHVWLAQETGRPVSSLFREPSWRLALNVGVSLMVVTITVMPRSERWWTRLTALIVACEFAWLGLRELRKLRA
jgi:hypothetical protein